MSRNPFLDLGFSPEDAAALHIRSQLAAALELHIQRKGRTQVTAARELKVPLPTISKIVNGNIEKLSGSCRSTCWDLGRPQVVEPLRFWT